MAAEEGCADGHLGVEIATASWTRHQPEVTSRQTLAVTSV